MLSIALTGYATAFSLILAIGAQNALVFRQGLARSHVFLICLFCAVSDAILIFIGVFGFATLTSIWPGLPTLMAVLGAIFLTGYAMMRLWAAWKMEYQAEISGRPVSLRAALISIGAVTWLNPHVYLDTLALIGAVSTQYEPAAQKLVFAIAAAFASFTFFFGLGYGARLLAPYMTSPQVWRGLDIGIAVVMLILAIGLVQYAL